MQIMLKRMLLKEDKSALQHVLQDIDATEQVLLPRGESLKGSRHHMREVSDEIAFNANMEGVCCGLGGKSVHHREYLAID